MGDIDIPSYFLCPISLQIMKDPVILSSGITYDRENIEKWMFSSKKNTCPATKQVLVDSNLTPNHTLLRLTQAWCTLNASHGIERIPTPRQQVDAPRIAKLINSATTSRSLMKCLGRLKSLAAESDRNKKCIESAGGVEFLASIIQNSYAEDGAINEALGILNSLQISEESCKTLMGNNGEFIQSLMNVLRQENYQRRAYAVIILRQLLTTADSIKLITLKSEIIAEVVNILRDQISKEAFKSALHILIEICPWGRNTIKASEAGAVPVLIELLLEYSDKRINEMMLVLLEQLCWCAEGRAELLSHGAGLAVVSKNILRVSQVATGKAVRILSSISRFSATPSVVQEMLQVGVVTKLCLVLQTECTVKTKDKAKEILTVHSRAWKNSSCLPVHLISSYPY